MVPNCHFAMPQKMYEGLGPRRQYVESYFLEYNFYSQRQFDKQIGPNILLRRLAMLWEMCPAIGCTKRLAHVLS